MSSETSRNVQLPTTHRPTSTYSNSFSERHPWLRALRNLLKSCAKRVRVGRCNEHRRESHGQENGLSTAPRGELRAGDPAAENVGNRAVHRGSVDPDGPRNMISRRRLSIVGDPVQRVASAVARRESTMVGVMRTVNFVAAQQSVVTGSAASRSLSNASSVSFGSHVRGFLLDVGPKVAFNMSRISSRYLVERAVGQGGQATVYAAKNDEGETVALKALRKSDYEGGAREMLFREVRVQSILLHPNVLKVFGMFDDVEHVYVVMEYAHRGDLMEEIMAGNGLNETRAATYTQQLASALRCCHSAGAVHRDIKPENVVIGADGSAKLTDFGWCLSPDTGGRSRLQACGTPEFRAPEMNGRTLYGKEVDMWALGLVIVEMLYGRRPSEVLRGPSWASRVRLPKEDSVSSDAKDLILGLLQRRVSKRLTAEQVLEHRWVVRNTAAPV